MLDVLTSWIIWYVISCAWYERAAVVYEGGQKDSRRRWKRFYEGIRGSSVRLGCATGVLPRAADTTICMCSLPCFQRSAAWCGGELEHDEAGSQKPMVKSPGVLLPRIIG